MIGGGLPPFIPGSFSADVSHSNLGTSLDSIHQRQPSADEPALTISKASDEGGPKQTEDQSKDKEAVNIGSALDQSFSELIDSAQNKEWSFSNLFSLKATLSKLLGAAQAIINISSKEEEKKENAATKLSS